jgi:hypothetical protein
MSKKYIKIKSFSIPEKHVAHTWANIVQNERRKKSMELLTYFK